MGTDSGNGSTTSGDVIDAARFPRVVPSALKPSPAGPGARSRASGRTATPAFSVLQSGRATGALRGSTATATDTGSGRGSTTSGVFDGQMSYPMTAHGVLRPRLAGSGTRARGAGRRAMNGC